jgi:hypothetical protein
MTTIESLAKRTLESIEPAPNQDGTKSDVLIAIAVIELIIQLVVVAWDCWKANPDAALAKCNKPNIFQRVYLRSLVRKVLAKEGVGRSQADATCNALLSMGRTITKSELMSAIIETHQNTGIAAKAAEYGVV